MIQSGYAEASRRNMMKLQRSLICLSILGLSVLNSACSVTEDRQNQLKSQSYHEISLPRSENDVPSKPVASTEEIHVQNNCQIFFDATLASAEEKLIQLRPM
jgi:hypothetical protein